MAIRWFRATTLRQVHSLANERAQVPVENRYGLRPATVRAPSYHSSRRQKTWTRVDGSQASNVCLPHAPAALRGHYRRFKGHPCFGPATGRVSRPHPFVELLVAGLNERMRPRYIYRLPGQDMNGLRIVGSHGIVRQVHMEDKGLYAFHPATSVNVFRDVERRGAVVPGWVAGRRP